MYHEWDDTKRTVSIVCDTWQVPNKWFIWHGRDIQANHLAPASNKAIRGTHQRHNLGGRDKLQGTEDQLLLEGKTQWKNWMCLEKKAGIKINNIFLTRLRNLIRMNFIPKLVAVLRCQTQELANGGAHPLLSSSVEVLLAQTLEIKQTACCSLN